jgi:hypothetical protein
MLIAHTSATRLAALPDPYLASGLGRDAQQFEANTDPLFSSRKLNGEARRTAFLLALRGRSGNRKQRI